MVNHTGALKNGVTKAAGSFAKACAWGIPVSQSGCWRMLPSESGQANGLQGLPIGMTHGWLPEAREGADEFTFAFRSAQLMTASSTGVKATGLSADGRATAAKAFMDTAAASGCRLVTATSAHTVFQPCTERMKPALPETSASTCSAQPAPHGCCIP